MRPREENDGARLHEVGAIQDGRACIPGLYVVRRGERSIEAASPGVWPVAVHRRDLECQRLPVRIQHAVQQEAAADAFQCERQRMRLVTPVWAIECHAVPLDACAIQHRVERPCGAAGNHITPLTEGNQLLHESMDVTMPIEQAPGA